ncbi:glycosyltransferase family 2 protein [Leifsonia shinshuensis]|uniref:Glycosyltransferase family 2 protein n=1 Tax=Leifsonia shinshuensis TaxID=150026 RepID=A0A7G6Y9C9_9MICO|nr:glycosyltransferase family 2 protein [Leifsonia shinshuensis]QNE35094.1 glycosyltransferase family 2 protein [Leifsonia shinshuensis]
MSVTIKVVTVTYNSSGVLEEFLASFAGAGVVPSEIVVVDNASRDIEATRAIADRFGARVLPLAENVGYGSAMNRGVASGEPADYYLLVNPDLVFAPDSLSRLLAVAEETPMAGSLGPSIFNDDGTLYPSARPLPSLGTGIGHALFSRAWPSNPWTRSYRSTLADGRPHAVGWLSGACLLTRRTVFERVHGFDERYFMYFEDVDLGRRIGLAGAQNLYVPAARATHHGGHSTSGASASMDAAHHDSAYLYLSEVYSGPWLAPLRVALKAGLRVRAHWLTGRVRKAAADGLQD